MREIYRLTHNSILDTPAVSHNEEAADCQYVLQTAETSFLNRERGKVMILRLFYGISMPYSSSSILQIENLALCLVNKEIQCQCPSRKDLP
jgi:hypothetical protein